MSESIETKPNDATQQANTPPQESVKSQAAPPDASVQQTPAQSEAKRVAELEAALKERDAKINDLATTVSTIEQRQREIQERSTVASEDELERRLNEIEELRLTDPITASKKNAQLLKDIQAQAAQRAQGAISQQTMLDKLKAGVKSANPEFDDDVVDYVMERADMLAKTGKYRTADEAIKAATTLVKSKFDTYAQKRNIVPPLPEGARAETANNPPPAAEPKDKPIPSPLEELESRRMVTQRKII